MPTTIKKIAKYREESSLLLAAFLESKSHIEIISRLGLALAKKSPIPDYYQKIQEHYQPLQETFATIQTLIEGVALVTRFYDERGHHNMTRETWLELAEYANQMAEKYPVAVEKLQAFAE